MMLARPLLWKETAEARSILWIAALIFFVLPFIGALEHIIQYHSFELVVVPWVVGLGGVLAAVAGVGVIVPDLTRRFEFIRSQPIPITRWLLTKYVVGLITVEIVLIVPLAINLLLVHKRDVSGDIPAYLLTMPFTWAIIYSAAFAIATLIRRTAVSIVAAVFVMLVLYSVPQLIPGMKFAAVFTLFGDLTTRDFDISVLRQLLNIFPTYLAFVATMLAGSAGFFLLAVRIVKRDLQIEASRKMIAWGIGGSALLLSLAGSLQLGTNMPVLQTIELDPTEAANRILRQGDTLLLVTREWNPQYGSYVDRYVNHRNYEDASPYYNSSVRRITMGPQITLGPKLALGPAFDLGLPSVAPSGDLICLWNLKALPDTRPAAERDDVSVPIARFPILKLVHLGETSTESASIDLPDQVSTEYRWPAFDYKGTTLTIVCGLKQLTFDISDWKHPKLTDAKNLSVAVGYLGLDRRTDEADQFQFRYAPESDLSANRLIEAYDNFGNGSNGNCIAFSGSSSVKFYVKGESIPGFVTYKRASRYAPLPIEQALVGNGYNEVISNGDMFALFTRQTHGTRVTLLDVVNPARPTAIGHYATPIGYNEPVGFLPDNRLIIGRHKLLVLGKPGE